MAEDLQQTQSGRKYIFTTGELKEILDMEEKIILYGVGDYGRKVADYIFSIGKQYKIASFWVTEYSEGENDYKGIKIYPLKKWQCQNQGSLVIITVCLEQQAGIVEIVQQYGLRYLCVTPDLYGEIHKKSSGCLLRKSGVTYEGLNFLLAGFRKCGTTSLYTALKRIGDVYLPEKKESEFFQWYDQVEKPKEKLIEMQFDTICKDQLVGMIEPTFFEYAKQIQEFFGKEIKIFFLVRNPVDAVFSEFRMHTCNAMAGRLIDIYQKFGGIYKTEVFEEWFNQNQECSFITTFKYHNWIDRFLSYYPREQIKVIIFEEMVRRPKKTMEDILHFIGSSSQDVCEELPRTNERNYVMANIGALEAAYRYKSLLNEFQICICKEDKSNRDKIFEELGEAKNQFKHAQKIYNLKLPENMRNRIKAYYNESVRKLEKMLDRDLSEVWF